MKKAMGIMNRVISLALGFVMCVSLFPIAGIDDYAFASEDDYIEIYDIEDLYNINNNMSGNYRLMQDIDMTEATAEGGDWDYMGNGWNPIGSGGKYGATDFSGTFDGNGHTITGMRIDITDWPAGAGQAYVGLFASVSGNVSNLRFADIDVSIDRPNCGSGAYNYNTFYGAVCGKTTGELAFCTIDSGTVRINTSHSTYSSTGYDHESYVGGICGWSNGGSIHNCSNNSNINSNVYVRRLRNYWYVGGIVGNGEGGTTLAVDSNKGNIAANCTVSGGYEHVYNFGGICGRLDGSAYETFNNGNITVSGDSSWGCGGVIGQLEKNGSVYNSYNTGNISRTTNYGYGGGIVGYAYAPFTVANCYNRGTIDDNAIVSGGYYTTGGASNYCYYLSGSGDSFSGATSLTDTQMMLEACFVGFDFDNTWFIDSTLTYPYPQLISNPQDTNKAVDEISISEYPDKISYYTEETVDVTGGILCVYYIDGTFELIPMTSDMVTDEPFTQTGPQSVIVTYGGATCSFDVNVSAMPNVTSMVLISPPNKTEFVKDTYFDFSGCRVRINFDNGTTREVEIDASMTTGGDIHTLGTQNIKGRL